MAIFSPIHFSKAWPTTRHLSIKVAKIFIEKPTVQRLFVLLLAHPLPFGGKGTP